MTSSASPFGVTLLADAAAAASVGQLMNESASNPHVGAAVEDNDDDYHPKVSKFAYLNHEGRIYRATSISDEITRFRCLRYLPAGTTPSAASIWKCRTSAKKENPSGKPYRCPGILMVNKETGRTLLHAAHECTLFRWRIPSEKSTTAGSSVAPSFGNNVGESSWNADGGVERRTPRKAIIFHEDDTSLSNEDGSSIASDKDYYKNLCRRLTASLIEKKGVKRENKQFKRENKRLKRENSELNERLRDISNLCAVAKGTTSRTKGLVVEHESD